MTFDEIKALAKNKWFLGTSAGVAALAAFVAYRRSKTGQGDAPPTGSAGYVQGGIDTTGTDIAAYLSEFSAHQNAALDEFGRRLTDALSAIDDGAVDDNTTRTPTPPPITAQPVPEFVKVTPYTKTNTSWSSTLSGIARQTGQSLSNLLSLNPQYKANPNLIHPGEQVRVK